MTTRDHIRQLQQQTSELIEQVAITRNGRLIAIVECLVRAGTVGPENAAQARGLADWEPPTAQAVLPSPSEALHALRQEEDR
jgi:hypothetical protein